jgi:class 3 adenylate cyclase
MTAPQRRLSAVLHADLSGFVRLVEAAEDLTFEQLRSARAQVLQPAIESAGGSVIHSVGDSLLAEFGSPDAAVRAAIDIQEAMARFNSGLAEEQRLLFRIGVHLAEIIVDEEGHDIFGDGVNLAERVQVMADPGGIAVSRAVREVTELWGDYAYVDGGEQRAKNVSRPIHIYRIRHREGDTTQPSASTRLTGTLRFRGADNSGHRFGFDLDADELKKRQRLVTIGRDAGRCDVVLSHSAVSRRHAQLSVGWDDTLEIEDMGSTNGTYVDGVAVKAGVKHALQPGAKLRIGDIELIVRYD